MSDNLIENAEALKLYLVEGVEIIDNKELFDQDKEYYFQDLGKQIDFIVPDIFSWFCEKTNSLCLELDGELYGRIAPENNKIVFFRETGFSSQDPSYLMQVLVGMLLFEGHIEEKTPEEKEEFSNELSEEDSDDLEWV